MIDIQFLIMHNTVPGGRALAKPIEDNQQLSGRCHYCGYSLKGLGKQGNCPECGTEYTEESASRLKPRPGALAICLRLGWPLFIVIGLFILFSQFLSLNVAELLFLPVFITMLFVVPPINGYFQVRSMLKKHLPEQKRTLGFIAGLRTIGTYVVWLWVVPWTVLVVLWVTYVIWYYSKHGSLSS